MVNDMTSKPAYSGCQAPLCSHPLCWAASRKFLIHCYYHDCLQAQQRLKKLSDREVYSNVVRNNSKLSIFNVSNNENNSLKDILARNAKSDLASVNVEVSTQDTSPLMESQSFEKQNTHVQEQTSTLSKKYPSEGVILMNMPSCEDIPPRDSHGRLKGRKLLGKRKGKLIPIKLNRPPIGDNLPVIPVKSSPSKSNPPKIDKRAAAMSHLRSLPQDVLLRVVNFAMQHHAINIPQARRLLHQVTGAEYRVYGKIRKNSLALTPVITKCERTTSNQSSRITVQKEVKAIRADSWLSGTALDKVSCERSGPYILDDLVLPDKTDFSLKLPPINADEEQDETPLLPVPNTSLQEIVSQCTPSIEALINKQSNSNINYSLKHTSSCEHPCNEATDDGSDPTICQGANSCSSISSIVQLTTDEFINPDRLPNLNNSLNKEELRAIQENISSIPTPIPPNTTPVNQYEIFLPSITPHDVQDSSPHDI